MNCQSPSVTRRRSDDAQLNNPGILDREQDRMEEARKEYAEALQIYQPFAKQDPQRFSADVARIKKLLELLPRQAVAKTPCQTAN
jgi:hypothetical protein